MSFGAYIIHPAAEEPTQVMPPIMVDNLDITQARIDRHGILQRLDNLGENQNSDIDFKPRKEKKKDLNDEKNKFIPGERLLYTIQRDKPELLNDVKVITTKKKDKLRVILDKLLL